MAGCREEERRTNAPMPIDSLIALTQLRRLKRLDIVALSHLTQKNEQVTRVLLEHLVEIGLAEGHGSHRQRDYTLSAAVYRRLGKAGDYVRQAGFDAIQQEQMI